MIVNNWLNITDKVVFLRAKMTMLALLCVPGTILGVTSIACVIEPGLAGIAREAGKSPSPARKANPIAIGHRCRRCGSSSA